MGLNFSILRHIFLSKMADGKIVFFQNGRQKPEVSKSENKMSRYIGFDPLITIMCITSAFEV